MITPFLEFANSIHPASLEKIDRRYSPTALSVSEDVADVGVTEFEGVNDGELPASELGPPMRLAAVWKEDAPKPVGFANAAVAPNADDPKAVGVEAERNALEDGLGVAPPNVGENELDELKAPHAPDGGAMGEATSSVSAELSAL